MDDYRTPLASNHLIKNGTTEYTVLRVLGAGGTGYVYLCKQSNGACVAIKELYPKELWHVLERQATGDLLFTGSSDSLETLDWYRQTVKSAALLEQEHTKSSSGDNNSPYFMQCLQTPFEDHGTLYTVYNTFEGNSFGDYIKEKRKLLTNTDFLSTILSIIIITCKKLSYLHQQNLLHMDISPWNIFVTNHGGLEDIPYLLDFGSAFKLGSDASLCRFSVTDGFTPAEIYRHATGIGKLPISAAVDTYSLVAVLFYALTGKTFDDALWEMNNDWSKLLEDYPDCEDLCEIFRIGLNSQHQRYQSADGLMDALCEYRAQIRGNNKNDDLDRKLSELNNAFETFQQKMLRQQQELKNEINQKLDDLGLTETARINKFFRIIDCILSATTKDHKSVGNVKSVLLTRYTFLSMCAYEGSDKAIKAHIDKSPDFTSPDITAERLNQLFQEKGRKDLFYAAFCERYRFETSKQNLISVCRLSTNDWTPEVEDYFTAWDFLIGAYKNCNHNDYFGYLKFEINRTVSEYMQCLVYMGFIVDAQAKKRYFDACKYLIETHNHYPYYILSLFGTKNCLGEEHYYFSDAEDFKPIKDLIALYFEDGFWTDMPQDDVGKGYIDWLCANKICSNNELLDLIQTRNCFDRAVWERLLKSSPKMLRTYAMNRIFLRNLHEFEDETKKRKAVGFILMLSKKKLVGELVNTTYAQEEKNAYNKAFSQFYHLLNLFLESKPAQTDPLINKKKGTMQVTLRRIKAMLFEKPEQNNLPHEISAKDSGCLKVTKQDDVLSSILSLGILERSGDTFTIKSKLCMHYNNETADNFFAYFEQVCHIAGKDNISKNLYNMCYQVVLESANESSLDKLMLSYCKYLAYSNSYTSPENQAVARDTIAAFLKQTTENTYDIFNWKCMHNLVFLLRGCQGEWLYRKLFLDLYESTPTKDYFDSKYEILGDFFRSRILNIYTLLNKFKEEQEQTECPYSRCFGQLLGGRLRYSWQVAHIMPLVKLLLQPVNFDALHPYTQGAVATFVARRLPAYATELSKDLCLGAMVIGRLPEIPPSMEPVCQKLLNLMEQDPHVLKKVLDVKTTDYIRLAKKLLIFYKNDPERTAFLAARAASILQGTIWAKLQKLSSNQSLLEKRVDDFSIIMSHPCIRGLAKHYADLLYEMLDHSNEHILRTESDTGDDAVLQMIVQIHNGVFPDWCDRTVRVGWLKKYTELKRITVRPEELIYPKSNLINEKRDGVLTSFDEWRKQTKESDAFVPDYAVTIFKRDGKLHCIDGRHLIWACENNIRAPKKIVAYLWTPEKVTLTGKTTRIVPPTTLWTADDLADMNTQLKEIRSAITSTKDLALLEVLAFGYAELQKSVLYRKFDYNQMAFKYFGDQMYTLLSQYSSQ